MEFTLFQNRRKLLWALIIAAALAVVFLLSYSIPANAAGITDVWGNGGVLNVTANQTINLPATSNANCTIYIFSGYTVTINGTSGVDYSGLAISMDNGAQLTLNNVSIDNASTYYAPLTSGGQATLLLRGTNSLKAGGHEAGVKVQKGNTLQIFSADGGNSGVLYAYGGKGEIDGYGGPGIGAFLEAGTVLIKSGTIYAYGYKGAAGIGCSDGANVSNLSGYDNISILGGIVYAESTGGGAGIGSGTYINYPGPINITGGIVTAVAKGPNCGAAIGSTNLGGVSQTTITISGGTVTADSESNVDMGSFNTNYSYNYISGGSVNASNVSPQPVVSSTKSTPVTLNTIKVPGVSGAETVGYSVDGGATVMSSTDSTGKLYLWLPSTGGDTVHTIKVNTSSVGTVTVETDPLLQKWGNGGTYTVTGSRTIDLTAFSANPDAGNLTIAASGSTTDIRINGDENVTYKNLRIYIDKGAHVTLNKVKIDNSSSSLDISPVEAGDSDAGNTLYFMTTYNYVTGSNNMPGVFVGEGKSLNLNRSSDPMAGSSLLNAVGGTDAAGIGGKSGGGAGTISTNYGGWINATGKGGGAGIGGGKNGAGGTLSVVNTILMAVKGSGAVYDIGGGAGASGGPCYLTSGIIFAANISNIPQVSSSDSTQLGRKSVKVADSLVTTSVIIDDNYHIPAKTDSNGYLYLYFPKGNHSHSVYDFYTTKLFIISDSSTDYLTVTKTDVFSYTAVSADNNGNIILSESGNYLISGNTTAFDSSIKLAQNVTANITLENVRLSPTASAAVDIDTNSTVEFVLKDTNIVSGGSGFPGINIPETSTLNITGTKADLLTVNGNGSAGIQNKGTVNINGGSISVTGGAGGAGIGGDENESGGTVSITGGILSATGGQGAAAMGGGKNGGGGIVTITGGTVKAIPGSGALNGIGSGSGTGLDGGTCYIRGGSINTLGISSIPVISDTDNTQLYLTTIAIPNNVGVLPANVSALSVNQGGGSYAYGSVDMQTDLNRKLYLYLPSNSSTQADLTANGTAYNDYCGTVSSGDNTLKMNQSAISITEVNSTYTYGDTISAASTGGSGDGAVTYIYSADDGVSVYPNCGAYTVTATKAEDASYYMATASKSFVIQQKSLTGAIIDSVNPQTYSGSPVTPIVHVTVDGKTLVEGTDYSVGYENNTNAASSGDSNPPTITVTGKGNYITTKSINFTINKKSITLTLTADPVSVTAKGDVLLSVSVSGAVDLPKGTVTFKDGSKVIATGAAITANGSTYTAETTWNNVQGGSHNLTAEYVTFAAGDNYSCASAAQLNNYNVVKLNQTGFAFTQSSLTKTYDDAPFAVTATGGESTGEVTYTVGIGSDVVSIDSSSGQVTILKSGTATITATKAADEYYNEVAATLDISIAAPLASTITVSASGNATSVEEGQTLQMSAAVLPAGAESSVNWSINNTTVATIDAAGRLTALKAGTVTVTAEATDGSGVTGSLGITVNAKPPQIPKVTSITVSAAGNATGVEEGQTLQMSAAVLPAGAESSVNWSVNNTTVAAINASGTLTALKAGTVTVTAEATDGSGVTGSLGITVNAKPPQIPKVTSIIVSAAGNATSVDEAQTLQMSAAVLPAGAESSVNWSVNNTTVAAINASGTLTALKAGIVTVTAEATDGSGVTGEIKITVNPQQTGDIAVNSEGNVVTLIAGSNIQMYASWPSDNTSIDVTWSVTSAAGISISDVGLLSADSSITSKMTVAVTATAKAAPAMTGTLYITVIPQVSSIAVSAADNATNLIVGQTLQLSAAVLPNAAIKAVSWAVSDTALAAIDLTGKLTALSAGTVTVTAAATDGSGISGTLEIQITMLTVNFNKNGGDTGATPEFVSAVYNGTVNLPANPARSGYVFTGWNTQADGKGNVFKSSSKVTSNITVYAQWTASGNNGSGNGGSSDNNGNTGSGNSNNSSTESKVSVVTKNGITVATVYINQSVNTSGNAVITAPQGLIAEAVAKAQKDSEAQGSERLIIEIKAKATGKANSATTELSQETLTFILEGKADALRLSNQIATITFDRTALSEIARKAEGKIIFTAAVVNNNSLSEEVRAQVGDRPVFDFTVTSGNQIISSFGGGKATVVIPYTLKEGEDAENVVIYYISEIGRLEKLSHCKYDAVTGTLFFTTKHFSKYSIGYVKINFTDVSATTAAAVHYLAARGITGGTGNNKFNPEGNISRAEFVLMLAKMARADLSKYKASAFVDVKENNWYFGAVQWAYENGITAGSEGKFNPNAGISRQDMAVMLIRYAENIEKYSLKAGNYEMAFSDSEKISQYARSSVDVLRQAGVLAGRNGNLFVPKANATRAEAARMLAVLLQNSIN